MNQTPAVSSLSPPSGGKPAGREPPEWPVERWIKVGGRVPALARRVLDRWAEIPLAGWPVRVFSSVWLGISLLGLLGIYIAIGSGFASLRAALEVTELQYFNAWPMRILLVLLAADLTVVTLRRIPLTLFKLGSWTVHVGILTLMAGCAWYFSQKHEGSVRIFLNETVEHSYDITERALYAFAVKADGSFDAAHPTITPIPSLPIFHERVAAQGRALDLALPGALGGGTDAQVRVTEYYPFAVLRHAGVRAAMPGEKGLGPALSVVLTDGVRTSEPEWLIAESPAMRVLEGEGLPVSIEYLRHPTEARLRELEASFDNAAGEGGITVRIAKLGIERTYPVKEGQAIAVEGSPYTLTPRGAGELAMASQGYEGASSATLMVEVERRDGSEVFRYTRNSVARYPERTPDFVDAVRRQEGVDSDIEIIFHDTSRTHAWIVERPDGSLSLIRRDRDGRSTTEALTDAPVALPTVPLPRLEMRLRERASDVVATTAPMIIPPQQRPRGGTAMDAIQSSLIAVEVSQGAWRHGPVYVPFSPYAQIGEPPLGRAPAVVALPGGGAVGLLLATTRRELPCAVKLVDFKPEKYPGAVQMYADYRSTLEMKDRRTGEIQTRTAHLNNPAASHGLYFFQVAWDGNENALPENRFSVLGVANRPGIPVMVVGSLLIVLGIGYAFYVKPILLKLKREALGARGKRPDGSRQ